MRFSLAVLALLGLPMAASAQQYLLVTESTTDRVMIFDAYDGSEVNTNFILNALSPYSFILPKQAIQVGEQIWVADQNADSIFRFDIQGQYIDRIGPMGLDNIRGMALVDGVVYLANGGSGNAAPGHAIITIDAATGQITGSFPAGDPWGVTPFEGGLLVSEETLDELERYTLSGVSQGVLVTTGFDLPQQMYVKENGNVLLAAYNAPVGIFEFTPAGELVEYLPIGTTSVRGVYVLGNGNIMFTDAVGVKVYDVTTGAITLLEGGSGHFISPLTLSEPCPADLDGSGTLTLGDFIQFRNLYVAGDLRADFDGSGALALNDFVAFRNTYVAGCP